MIRVPVHRVLDADINSGAYKLMGGGVIRINHAAAPAAGDKAVGGALTPVYFVSGAQLATPRFKLVGGRVKSGQTYTYAGNAAAGIKGHVAIPVYDPTVVP